MTPEARSAVGRPTRAQRRRIEVKGGWAVTLVHEPGAGDHGSGALAGASGEALVSAAWRSRLADRELAAELQRPEPAGPAVSSRCLEELERRAPLPQALERELIAAAQAGDAHARARLVEAFLPLVASAARVYRDSPRVERLELLQEGVVGLLRALQRFDPDRGVPFWGYAVWWVRQAMQQLVDVPGVSGDDLKVELYDDVLRIHGERPFPYTDEDDRDRQRLERGFGTFERVLRVPEGLDPDRISASMTNGVLTLHLRKPEVPEPKRIEIMDAAGRPTLESGSERELVGSPS